MSFHRHRTLYLALLAALFVFVQAHALGHAAEHGDEPHDHYGAACELSVIATDQILLPAAPSEPGDYDDVMKMIEENRRKNEAKRAAQSARGMYSGGVP